ncbi:MAG: iron chelate uptake ABC transporter family permease subunit, partial [Bellilinea sp.]
MEITRTARPYWIALLALASAMLLSILVGSVPISFAALVEALRSGVETTAGKILFSLRLPRTILVAMTGAALAGSGTAYQGLFRNPLADPYLIGV